MLYIILCTVYGIAIVFTIGGLLYIILLHILVLVGAIFKNLDGG